jgi:hypothetical protein
MNKQQYRDARKLIEKKEHWTQNYYGRDAKGGAATVLKMFDRAIELAEEA